MRFAWFDLLSLNKYTACARFYKKTVDDESAKTRKKLKENAKLVWLLVLNDFQGARSDQKDQKQNDYEGMINA